MEKSQNDIILPNSDESEKMALGCMLTNDKFLNIAAKGLEESDFYYPRHKIIFQVLKSAYKDEKPADILLVLEELKRHEKLKAVGGPEYITYLAQYAGTSGNIEQYVEVLKKLSIQRQLVYFGQDVLHRAADREAPSHIIAWAHERIKQIEKHRGVKEKFPIKFLDQNAQNFLLVEPAKKPMLLEFTDDSAMTFGFLPKGIVAMLIGAGGIGKTHLLSQLALSIATGTPWLEKFTTTKYCGMMGKGNVFLGMGENQYDDIHRVLYKSAKILRKHQPDLLQEDILKEASKRIAAFSFCGQQAAFIENKNTSIYFRDFKNRLIDITPKEGWSLIILDPVSRLLGADAETDNAAATQFIALLEELVIELPGNPTVLFAHHVNKAAIKLNVSQDQTAARGSSALTDGVRWQVNFSKSEEKNEHRLRILKMTKSNFTAFIPDVTLEQDHDGYLKAQKNTRDIPLNTKQI